MEKDRKKKYSSFKINLSEHDMFTSFIYHLPDTHTEHLR